MENQLVRSTGEKGLRGKEKIRDDTMAYRMSHEEMRSRSET